jgi:hypothetical protein
MSSKTFISPAMANTLFTTTTKLPNPGTGEDDEISDEEGRDTEYVNKLESALPKNMPSFFGKSGNANLVQQVVDLKVEKTGYDRRLMIGVMQGSIHRRPENLEYPRVRMLLTCIIHSMP